MNTRLDDIKLEDLRSKDPEATGDDKYPYSLDIEADGKGVRVFILINGSYEKSIEIKVKDGAIVLETNNHVEDMKKEIKLFTKKYVDIYL